MGERDVPRCVRSVRTRMHAMWWWAVLRRVAMVGVGGGAMVSAVACASTPHRPLAPRELGELAGCYTLTLGPWARGPVYGRPPAHFRREGEPDPTVGRWANPVRPALSARGRAGTLSSSWRADTDDTVRVSGLAGSQEFRLALGPAGRDRLRGFALVLRESRARGVAEFRSVAAADAVREECPPELR